MSKDFLVLDQVAKTYADGTVAVRGIDLRIAEGEFVVLLGPSGCGKTTTLRMVAGLELATGGTIRLDGKDVTGLPPSQRDVGFVFQFYALYPHLRVADNIAFPLVATGVPPRERKERVAAVAESLGITGLLDRSPRQLSGGDRQRVSLARAMVRRPRVWLMDEPLGTLDADVRDTLRDFIREQQLAHRVTTLYVTHDQEEAMALADRVVVMDAGLIQQAGPPAAVYDRPANRFVATFVGSPGMNFLPGASGEGLFVPSAGGPGIAAAGLPPGPAILGIRAEHLRLTTVGAGVPGTVAGGEYLGAWRLVHVRLGDGSLAVVRSPSSDRSDRPASAIGDAVGLAIAPAGVRWFATDGSSLEAR
ncbi:ABC transporter ATP-binding protein [Planctomycetota bacterium]|nr:ABC transporter ATP-binding protein [Planctomycetota bacterium]